MNTTNAKAMNGRVVLVTGAASGIGKATALRLAAEGARVALADANESALMQVAAGIFAHGGEAFGLRLDVRSEADWQWGMQQILAKWERLDGCVNGAGIAFAQPILDLEIADWHRVLAVNLDGVLLGTKHAFRALRDCGGGAVVNIASAAGIEPYAGNAAYGTSKAAIRFFTRIAALEGQPHRICVNSVSPSAVATAMWKGTPMWPRDIEETHGMEAALQALVRNHDFATPEAVAEIVAFLVGPEATHLTGRDFRTLGETHMPPTCPDSNP